MGKVQNNHFEPTFPRAVKVQATDLQIITSDPGVVLLREAESRLGIIQAMAERMEDPRRADRVRYGLDELIRERLFALALGYSTQDDVERIAHDPAFQAVVWNRSGDQVLGERLASQPTQSRLIHLLTDGRRNLEALRDGLSESAQDWWTVEFITLQPTEVLWEFNDLQATLFQRVKVVPTSLGSGSYATKGACLRCAGAGTVDTLGLATNPKP